MTVLVGVACGRASVDPPAGRPGGPCYPNDTCDRDALCWDGTCVDVAVYACPVRACADHGHCLVVDGQPTCTCDSGWTAVGLVCLPCPTPDCAGGPCPADMVMATIADGGEAFCIDRYEATVFDSPSCVGTRFGAVSDDFPATFDDRVESDACTDECGGELTVAEGAPLYACSLPGFVPTSYVSWFQAKRACENAGKRLCNDAQWRAACRGPSDTRFPYGDVYDGERCNVYPTSAGLKAATASFPQCEGGFPGLLDAVGNLAELTNWGSHGGGFGSHGDTPDCDSLGSVTVNGNAEYGFRCCRDL